MNKPIVTRIRKICCGRFLPFNALLFILGFGCTNSDNYGGDVGNIAVRSSAISNETPADAICKFAVYGTQKADVRDRTSVSNGMVGSGAYVEVGSTSTVTGTVKSSGNVLLRGSTINGDVIAGTTIQQQEGTTVTGVVLQNTAVPAVSIPSKAFDAGTQAVNVYAGQTLSLSPGRYGVVKVYGNATLSLQTGTYELKKFIIDASNAKISMDVGQGSVIVNVKETLSFGNQLKVSLVNGTDSRRVQFYAASQEQINIGTDVTFYGDILAPSANVVVASRVNFSGSIHAKNVTVDTDGHVTASGCETVDSDYPLGADTMTKSIGIWWPDYRRDQISTVNGLRLGIENILDRTYIATVSLRFYGPSGTQWTKSLGERTLAPGGQAILNVSAVSLPIRSETSAMVVQPEIIIKRPDADPYSTDDEIRTAPPIYYRHAAGSSFTKIELFDERTLMSQRNGRIAWGTGATVSQGDLLGYIGETNPRTPILAGQGTQSAMYNELGEVVGYRLGAKLSE